MYSELFERIGLNKNESLTLNYLIKNGISPVSNIVKGIGLNKGLIYIALENLVKLKLVSEDKKSKVSAFSPENPYKLLDFMNNKENDIKKTKNDLENNISKIMSDFNLVSNKPGVRFFEGDDAVITLMNDQLTSKTDIYAYIDDETLSQNINLENKNYVNQRKKTSIKKYILFKDCDFARKNNKKNDLTEFKFLKDIKSFKSTVQIYDNKVSFLKFEKDNRIGIIIQDKTIYETFKAIFDNDYKNAAN